jgi:hypothetical protein
MAKKLYWFFQEVLQHNTIAPLIGHKVIRVYEGGYEAPIDDQLWKK